MTHHPLCMFREADAHPLACADGQGSFSGWPRLTPSPLRTFETGATRDTEDGKLDYEGFLHPEVLERFAQYMHEHRLQRDGSVRDSDNWQNGMPLAVYMKSLLRHVFELWRCHRRRLMAATIIPIKPMPEPLEAVKKNEMDAACAILFNTMGYMFQRLRGYTE